MVRMQVEENREQLDRRVEEGKIWWGMGDTKLFNWFAVSDERVCNLDPITLFLRLRSDEGEDGQDDGERDEDDFVVAPWCFRDQLSELAYFLIYIRAQEKVDPDQKETYRQLRELALSEYEAVYGEDASRGK